jgi:ankyrin repeat protein
MASFPSSDLRRGKWTAEEEAYATRVILAFKEGLLDVARGTSLRSYLSDKLNCAPMRITKKFAGDASIGKSVFHPREDASPATIERSRREIAELEEAWRRKLGILPGSSHTMSSAAGHRKRTRPDSDDSDEEEEEDDDDKVGETEKEEEDPRHPLISEDMAAVVGVSRANHFRLVKLLWKYIKAHDLQNPSKRTEILCDAKLQKVFKRKKVTSFGMSKLLGAHIFKDGDPQATNYKGKTQLLTACCNGQIDVIRMLLDNGADVDQNDEGSTPLFAACENGHVDAARLLLDKGADVNRAKENGSTPLFIACEEGHVDAARLLLEKGADVNQATENGQTPLYMACWNGHVDVARLLLAKGAEVDRAVSEGWKEGETPLRVACENRHVDGARLLLKKGADVNRADKNGATPLAMACHRGHSEVRELLRKCGAVDNPANNKPKAAKKTKKGEDEEQQEEDEDEEDEWEEEDEEEEDEEDDEDEEKKFPYKSITFYVNAGSNDEIISDSESDSESDSVGYHRTTYERSIFGRPAFKSIRTPKYGGETIVFETPRKWYDIRARVDMEPMGEYGRRIPYEFMEQAITFGFHYEMEDIDTLEELDVECSFFEGETRTGGHEIWHSHDHSQQKNYQFVGYEKALSDIEEFEADEDRKKCLEEFYEESGDWPCVRYELRRKPRTKDGLQIKFIDAKLVRMESPDHCIQRLELPEGWDL